MCNNISKLVAREASLNKQHLRDPFDLLPMALNDALRPGELVGQQLVDTRVQEPIEPESVEQLVFIVGCEVSEPLAETVRRL